MMMVVDGSFCTVERSHRIATIHVSMGSTRSHLTSIDHRRVAVGVSQPVQAVRSLVMAMHSAVGA